MKDTYPKGLSSLDRDQTIRSQLNSNTMKAEKNKDGSPTKVWCHAYQDYTPVTCWEDYHYFKVFDGENHERAAAIADNAIYEMNK